MQVEGGLNGELSSQHSLNPPACLDAQFLYCLKIGRIGHGHDQHLDGTLGRSWLQTDRYQMVLLGHGERHQLDQVIGNGPSDHVDNRNPGLFVDRLNQCLFGQEAMLHKNLTQSSAPLLLKTERGLELEFIDGTCFHQNLPEFCLHLWVSRMGPRPQSAVHRLTILLARDVIFLD